jgi:isopropylmalate/homocitrate/citramalate synthase
MEKKLRMTPDQVFEQARQSVRFARNLVATLEFSPRMVTAATRTSCAVCSKP